MLSAPTDHFYGDSMQFLGAGLSRTGDEPPLARNQEQIRKNLQATIRIFVPVRPVFEEMGKQNMALFGAPTIASTLWPR